MSSPVILWQVSVDENSKRKYYQFTTLKKALRFMEHWISEYIEDNNAYPGSSLNLQPRMFEKVPKNVDKGDAQ